MVNFVWFRNNIIHNRRLSGEGRGSLLFPSLVQSKRIFMTADYLYSFFITSYERNCSLTCTQGFLLGISTITCQSSGVWTVIRAQCVLHKPGLNNPPTGIILSSNSVPENSAFNDIIGKLTTIDSGRAPGVHLRHGRGRGGYAHHGRGRGGYVRAGSIP